MRSVLSRRTFTSCVRIIVSSTKPTPSEVFTREPTRYQVKQRERGKKDTQELSGSIALPDDVYNGMTATILNNLARGETATGHVLAFTPMETLVAATKLGGEIMGLANELGQIKPGFLADLLLVDGDPLADIKRFQNRDALLVIMKDGRLHKSP